MHAIRIVQKCISGGIDYITCFGARDVGMYIFIIFFLEHIQTKKDV